MTPAVKATPPRSGFSRLRWDAQLPEISPFELALEQGHAKTAEMILLEAIRAGADMSDAAVGAADMFFQAVTKCGLLGM